MGQLIVNSEQLTPCFVVVQWGWSNSWLRQRNSEEQAIFTFGEPDAIPNQVTYFEGLILPLSLCRDVDLKNKFMTFGSFIKKSKAKSYSRSSHRQNLEKWLEDNQLNSMRISDLERIDSWVLFDISSQIIKDVLNKFDYVTGFHNQSDQTIAISQHQQFKWSSYGELLEWFVENDLRRGDLSLYYANDFAAINNIVKTREGKVYIFRPPNYGEKFTLPNPQLPACGLVIEFFQGEHDFDWIDMTIKSGEEQAEITFSGVYDPFPGLLDWLQAIADNDMPVGVTVDEEYSLVDISAFSFPENNVQLVIVDRNKNELRGSFLIEKEEMLKVFRREFADLFFNRLDTKRWSNCCETDSEGDYIEAKFTKYVKRLFAHPFLEDVSPYPL